MPTQSNRDVARTWTATELRRLLPAQRDAILEAAAEQAAADYETDPALTAFEAFGEDEGFSAEKALRCVRSRFGS
jgi:hypothetical protein